MEQPRYKVSTCSGYRIMGHESATGSGNTEGVSAHILDRWNCHRVVRTYRSEDVNRRHPKQRGHTRTLALAEAECASLNRQQHRASGRERA